MRALASVLIAYVLVLEAFSGDALFGRMIGFGFETEEQCAVRLQEILREKDETGMRYVGACIPADELGNYLRAEHERT